MTVVQIGPFIGRVEVDLDDRIILGIYHVNDIHRISHYDMDRLFEERPDPDHVSQDTAEEALREWLNAGEGELRDDLVGNKAPYQLVDVISESLYYTNKVRVDPAGNHYYTSSTHDRIVQMDTILTLIDRLCFTGLEDITLELKQCRDQLQENLDKKEGLE